MIITAINGSPRLEKSVSELIINKIAKIYGEPIKTYYSMKITNGETSLDVITEILHSDILLIIFPLYVDSMPSHLIELLLRLEAEAATSTDKPRIFTVVNCGFYEAVHTELVVDMLRHFANRSGFPWGYGIGIGGGGMLASMGENMQKGPLSNIYSKLCDLCNSFNDDRTKENVFISPGIPRFMYKTIAQIGFKSLAKKNKVKNIRARPYVE